MLFTKDVKIIQSDDKKSYTSFTFDRPNFEHPEDAKTKEYKPKVKGKPTMLADGTEFTGTKPEFEVSAGLTTEQIDGMYNDMLAYVVPVMLRERKNKKGETIINPYEAYTDTNDAAKLFCMSCVSDAMTAYMRLDLDATNREQTVDMPAVRYAQAKTFIKASKDKGKEITLLQAYLKVAKSEALELIEAAEDAGEDLSMDDALLSIEWYQEMLTKAEPVTA